MKTLIVVLIALMLAAILGGVVLAGFFARDISRLETRLTETAPAPIRTDLPKPIRTFALRGMFGATPATYCQLTQSVEMRLAKGGDWQPLSARQTIAAGVPGFTWVAVQKRAFLPIMRVIDSYVDGAGLLDIRLLSAFRLGVHEGPEAALGEALRYLVELAWCPDAMLTNPDISWAETPEGITAALSTPGGMARVIFSLNAAGDITGTLAKGRPATMPDGSILPLDWQGTLSDYSEFGGRRIPTRGEVGYIYPDGYEAYWRGQITGYSTAAR